MKRLRRRALPGTTGAALPGRGWDVGKGCAGLLWGRSLSVLPPSAEADAPARCPTPLFERTCCHCRKHRRDPRNGGSNGAFLSPLPFFDCRMKRTPQLLPCPRPSQAPPGGERGSRTLWGHQLSQESPHPADLLRNRWWRSCTCLASPGPGEAGGEVELKPQNLEQMDPMRTVLWWVPSVMKRLKKSWEIILTLGSAPFFFSL